MKAGDDTLTWTLLRRTEDGDFLVAPGPARIVACLLFEPVGPTATEHTGHDIVDKPLLLLGETRDRGRSDVPVVRHVQTQWQLGEADMVPRKAHRLALVGGECLIQRAD